MRGFPSLSVSEFLDCTFFGTTVVAFGIVSGHSRSESPLKVVIDVLGGLEPGFKMSRLSLQSRSGCGAILKLLARKKVTKYPLKPQRQPAGYQGWQIL